MKGKQITKLEQEKIISVNFKFIQISLVNSMKTAIQGWENKGFKLI